jgi:hypothetical protein
MYQSDHLLGKYGYVFLHLFYSLHKCFKQSLVPCATFHGLICFNYFSALLFSFHFGFWNFIIKFSNSTFFMQYPHKYKYLYRICPFSLSSFIHSLSSLMYGWFCNFCSYTVESSLKVDCGMLVYIL